MYGRFSLEPFPPERPPRLIAMGCPWNKRPAPAEVEVNGRVIWRGEPFTKPGLFTKFEIEIPVDALERNSRFVIRNTAPENDGFLKHEIHYVVIKK